MDIGIDRMVLKRDKVVGVVTTMMDAVIVATVMTVVIGDAVGVMTRMTLMAAVVARCDDV